MAVFGRWVLTLPLIAAGAVPFSPELASFPGPVFEATRSEGFFERAPLQWPGPDTLVKVWRGGGLDQHDMLSLLLGGAAFHDPKLLPILREAATHPDGRVRQAAVYGYRHLIGDGVPNVAPGVSLEDGRRVGEEIRLMEQTLRLQPLAAIWIQAALTTEGRSLPGWSGVVPRRPASSCWLAVERVLQPEDLDLLTAAAAISEDRANRLALMRLVETFALERFEARDRDPMLGKSRKDQDRALEKFDAWLSRRCGRSFDVLVANQLVALGLPRMDPMSQQACTAWELVLLSGDSAWWPLAARQLAACGAPAVELSRFRRGSKSNEQRREWVLDWFMVRSRVQAGSRSQTPARP
jgi:hypothetical protein